MPSNWKVFLVDDHPIVREGMGQLIENEPDMSLCGESDGGASLFDDIESTLPDVIVLDLSLKNASGFDYITDIRRRWPKSKVFVLSMHDEKLYAERSLRAGASGYIMKQEAPAKVIDAIREVALGGIYLSDSISKIVLQGIINPSANDPIASLSDREIQVFQFIGEGKTHQAIAEHLHLSIKTIESHVERIKNKLSLKSGRELMHRAIEWVISNQGPVN